MGHKVTVYEKRKQLGGMMRYGIPAYRFPREIMDGEIKGILSLCIDVKTGVALSSANVPYGSNLYFKHGDTIKKGDLIADWDPFNAVILSDVAGRVQFNDIIEGVTYRVETDEQTNIHDKVIIESRLKTKNPSLNIVDEDGDIIKSFDVPVGARLAVEEGQVIDSGEILVKILRSFGKSGDITGGLPRVTELFEARNPSDPAVVSEIDGVVSFEKKLKRGNLSHPDVQTDFGSGKRLREGRYAAVRRLPDPCGHPEHQGCAEGARVHHQRNPGGVSSARCEDQRQAL